MTPEILEDSIRRLVDDRRKMYELETWKANVIRARERRAWNRDVDSSNEG